MMLPFFHIFKPSSRRYGYIGELEGYTSQIEDLEFSKNGQILATGDENGVQLWSVHNMKPIPSPTQPTRGLITHLKWAGETQDAKETLCFGTQLGFIIIWQQDENDSFDEICEERLGTGNEITCLAVEATDTSIKIAVGTISKIVQVWTYNDQNELQSVFSVALDTTIAASLAFHSTEDSVLVFGLQDGYLHVLDATGGQVISSSKVSSKIIGCVDVSWRRDQYVLDNVLDGFDLYDTETNRFLRNFRTGKVKKRSKKQVSFAEDSRVVVGGGDNGVVYVFDRRTTEMVDQLNHASGGMVPAISTCSANGVSFIATGSAIGFGRDRVRLWAYSGIQGGRAKTSSWNLTSALSKVLKLALLSVIIVGLSYGLTLYRESSMGVWGPRDIPRSDAIMGLTRYDWSFWNLMLSFYRERVQHGVIQASQSARAIANKAEGDGEAAKYSGRTWVKSKSVKAREDRVIYL